MLRISKEELAEIKAWLPSEEQARLVNENTIEKAYCRVVQLRITQLQDQLNDLSFLIEKLFAS